MNYCTCCNVRISSQEISVRCNVCRNKYIPACVDLSSSEAYKVNRNIGLSWTCKTCLPISNDVNFLKRKTLSQHAELKALPATRRQSHKVATGKSSGSTTITSEGYQRTNEQLRNSGILGQAGRKAKLINKANSYGMAQYSTVGQNTFIGDRIKQSSQDEGWICTFCKFLNPSSASFHCSECLNLNKHIGLEPLATLQNISLPDINPLHLSLLHLDDQDLVRNSETFECAICFAEVKPGQGAILKECLHQFCKQCLADTVQHSNDAEIKCPYGDDLFSCDSLLQDREIKALVNPELYEQYVARSVAVAEKKIQNSFHCQTPNCGGWCIYEDDVNTFRCPICNKENCLTCRAIHEGMNCKHYQEELRMDAKKNQNTKKTEEAIKKLIEIGEAMNCPGCRVVIMRKYGCDWLQCTACKMEICWITKGARWGPRGKNDISGGCKCGVNGKKCHPQCNNCH